jgi:hypothetical protein
VPKAKFNPLIYGIWITADGCEVLFSRSYHPLFKRQPGQPAVEDDPDRWVHHIVQRQYFFDDHSYQFVKSRLPQIKRDFIDGRPITVPIEPTTKARVPANANKLVLVRLPTK